MKVLLVNGSPHEKGCTYTALAEIAKTLNSEGIDTEIFHIGAEPISGCRRCGACRKQKRLIMISSLPKRTMWSVYNRKPRTESIEVEFISFDDMDALEVNRNEAPRGKAPGGLLNRYFK